MRRRPAGPLEPFLSSLRSRRWLSLGSCGTLDVRMDFENLFSKPPNPALGRKPVTDSDVMDSDDRIDDEIDDTEVEETQEEKIKVKVECEHISKKFRHFGNSTASPENLLYRKSRSKDYDVYTDNICNQEPEDNFPKELQQHIQVKEMANAAQSLLSHKESMKKEEAKCTQEDVKQKNKNFKAAHKNGKQKKMKRKWPGTADKGSYASLRNSGSQGQFRHFGNSTTSPKNLLYRKSRSKDYDVYTDNICNQEPEDNFAKELQQYIQAREMAKAAQSLLSHKESMKKEEAKCTQEGKDVKQKNKNFNAAHKNGKQKKMKRKWPGTADKGSYASLRNSGSQGQDDKPKENQQHVQMNQGFINQHTVERKGKQVCKYFLERKCIKGDECKFDHDAEIEKKKEMCKFYVQGYCTKAENCLYLHNEYPCKFYHTGAKCYQGEGCKFSHAPLTAETQELLVKVLNTEKKSS